MIKSKDESIIKAVGFEGRWIIFYTECCTLAVLYEKGKFDRHVAVLERRHLWPWQKTKE